MAELAAELLDEAVHRVESTLGDGPISHHARLRATAAAMSMCKAALESARSRHDSAAKDRALKD
jgi:hypothetical protein